MDEKIVNFIVCPECKSDSFTVTTFSKIDESIHDGIVKCTSCGTWFKIEKGILDLLPLSLRRHDLYETFAKKYNIQFTGTGKSQGESQKINQILFFKKDFSIYDTDIVNSAYYRALDFLTFESWFIKNVEMVKNPVLEIGCGTGRQTIKIAANYPDAVCLDISEEMVAVAKSKIDAMPCKTNFYFIIGDAENPPVKNTLFGACIVCGTLHHLSSPEKAIRNISNKLVDGGLFYSVDPNASKIRFIFDFLMKIWKLYDEEASGNPLLNENELKLWFSQAQIRGTFHYSTYIPPHIFKFLNANSSITLLRITDSLFNKIPGSNKFSGMICFEGEKDGKNI